LKAQFIGNSMKTLLRSQIESDLAQLSQRVQAFTRQLGDFMQIEIQDQQGNSVSSAACSTTMSDALPDGQSTRSFSTTRWSTPILKRSATICV